MRTNIEHQEAPIKVKVEGIKNLYSTNSQIIGKPKDEDEIGEELKFAIIEKNYNIRNRKFLLYCWIQKSTIPSYGH